MTQQKGDVIYGGFGDGDDRPKRYRARVARKVTQYAEIEFEDNGSGELPEYQASALAPSVPEFKWRTDDTEHWCDDVNQTRSDDRPSEAKASPGAHSAYNGR